MDDRKLLQE